MKTWPQASFSPAHTVAPSAVPPPFPWAAGKEGDLWGGRQSQSQLWGPRLMDSSWISGQPTQPRPRRPFMSLLHVILCLQDSSSFAREPGPLKPQRQLIARRKSNFREAGGFGCLIASPSAGTHNTQLTHTRARALPAPLSLVHTL